MTPIRTAPPRLPRRLIPALLVAAIWLGPLPARSEEGWTSPLRPGAWAAEFEIDPVYQYGIGFSGAATLSMKRCFSERTALRFGASIGFRENASDNANEIYEAVSYYYPDTLIAIGNSDYDNESHSYALFVHMMRHAKAADRVSLFFELGPSFRYEESHTIESYFEDWGSPAQSTAERISVDRVAAIDASLGFEWYFARRLSLCARVGAFGGYTWGEKSQTSERVTADGTYYRRSRERGDSQGLQIQTSRSTLSLVGYF